MTEPALASFDPSPSTPKLKLSPGSWDTHCHVFGPRPRFPFTATTRPELADAPKERLFALHKMLGIERCVIVQSAMHGLDNGAVEDALIAKSGSYLGVALLPVTVGDAELRRLDAIGFRGVRFNFMPHLKPTASIEEVLAFAPRLAAIGWHLQIHMAGSLMADIAPKLQPSSVPVVIDHIGRIDAKPGIDQPAFHALMRLMSDPRMHVKLSGCDRNTAIGPPYTDALAFAKKLVAEFPDQVLWGTDWPHPNHKGPVPDDGALVDLAGEMAPTPGLLAKLMVDNPKRFYERSGR
jgi:2-pyrone-4,6-dicarboxylate lactonase